MISFPLKSLCAKKQSQHGATVQEVTASISVDGCVTELGFRHLQRTTAAANENNGFPDTKAFSQWGPAVRH
jgi:hypothetical protein